MNTLDWSGGTAPSHTTLKVKTLKANAAWGSTAVKTLKTNEGRAR